MVTPWGCPTKGSRRHLECVRAPSLAASVPRYPAVRGGTDVAAVPAGAVRGARSCITGLQRNGGPREAPGAPQAPKAHKVGGGGGK